MTRQEGQQTSRCSTCCDEILLDRTRVSYNLDGTLHFCKAEEREAYRKFCELVKKCYHDHSKIYDSKAFWRWKQELDRQLWRKRRDYYNLLKEQQRRAEARLEASP